MAAHPARPVTFPLSRDAAPPLFAYCLRSARHWPCGSNRRSGATPVPPPPTSPRAPSLLPHGLRSLLSAIGLRQRPVPRLPLEPLEAHARLRHERPAVWPAEQLAPPLAARPVADAGR